MLKKRKEKRKLDRRNYVEKKKSKNEKEWFEYNKDLSLKRNYGIGLKEYENIFIKQNGKCVICEDNLKLHSKETHLDHCHTTGEVRGILYSNSVIANYNEESGIIRRWGMFDEYINDNHPTFIGEEV